jgi:hypothetical protein
MRINWRNFGLMMIVSICICFTLAALGFDWWARTLIDCVVLILVVAPILPPIEIETPKE